MQFEGKVCLVSGGGSGIGLAVAALLLSQGAKVVIASRKEGRLRDAMTHLSSANASYRVLNIRDEKSVADCLEYIIATHGAIDCLVNNGGGQFAAPAEVISLKGWKAVIDTNLNGTWSMTSQAFHLTEPQRTSGRPLSVVNVTVDNFTGFPGFVHTGAARAGVENFTKTLCREWGRKGFRINCVAPGIIASSGIENYPAELRPHFLACGRSTPLGRCGSEGEVAAAIVFLLSPQASYISGVTLRVDGGGSLAKDEAIPRDSSGDLAPPPAFHVSSAERSLFEARTKAKL